MKLPRWVHRSRSEWFWTVRWLGYRVRWAVRLVLRKCLYVALFPAAWEVLWVAILATVAESLFGWKGSALVLAGYMLIIAPRLRDRSVAWRTQLKDNQDNDDIQRGWDEAGDGSHYP